jgi:hypothetical protein
MILSVLWGRIQGQTWNFKHLVHETWPPTYVRFDFKLYKMQTKFKNHETCRDVVASHVEAVIKIWECFEQVVMHDAWSPVVEMSWHRMTSRQVSWFSDFVCILYNLKSNHTQVGGHVSCLRCLKFHVSPWIRPHNTLKIMNIIFWIAKFHYSMHLQFKFAFYGKIQVNETN